jgi:hypothetical protein
MLTALLIFSVVSFALILRCALLHGRRAETLSVHEWKDRRHQIDVETFRALLDRDDCQYLRKSLSPREFQAFQRTRIRLALRMLRMVEENADLLTQIGRLGRLDGDPLRRQQADKLVAAAIQFRLNLLRVRFCLCMQWLYPSWTLSLRAFAMQYEHLWDSLIRFQQHKWQQSS